MNNASTIVRSNSDRPVPEFLAHHGVTGRVPRGMKITKYYLRGFGSYGYDEFGTWCFFHDQHGWLYGKRGKAWCATFVRARIAA